MYNFNPNFLENFIKSTSDNSVWTLKIGFGFSHTKFRSEYLKIISDIRTTESRYLTFGSGSKSSQSVRFIIQRRFGYRTFMQIESESTRTRIFTTLMTPTYYSLSMTFNLCIKPKTINYCGMMIIGDTGIIEYMSVHPLAVRKKSFTYITCLFHNQLLFEMFYY